MMISPLSRILFKGSMYRSFPHTEFGGNLPRGIYRLAFAAAADGVEDGRRRPIPHNRLGVGISVRGVAGDLPKKVDAKGHGLFVARRAPRSVGVVPFQRIARELVSPPI